VAADTANGDVDAVDIGKRIAGSDSDHSGRKRGGVMESNDIIGLGEAGVEPVLKHRRRTGPNFLGGLEDHHQRSRPLVLHRRKTAGGSDPAGHVRVVPAGVHHRRLGAVGQRSNCLGSEGQTGLLVHRERVHVGAKHQHRAWSVFHHRDDTGPADLLRDLETELAHLSGELCGRANLLE
jgi:hypothetical protein